LDAKQLFNIGWKSYVPGEMELYTYVNLCTGELHGGDVLQLNLKDVHLILFKMEVEPHHVLTEAELHDYLSEHNGYSPDRIYHHIDEGLVTSFLLTKR